MVEPRLLEEVVRVCLSSSAVESGCRSAQADWVKRPRVSAGWEYRRYIGVFADFRFRRVSSPPQSDVVQTCTPTPASYITAPDQPQLEELCRELAARSAALDSAPAWPAEQLALCARAGVFRWFVPESVGGFGWSEADVLRGYLKLSAACLTTTFILTQFTSACRRIVDSDNESLARRWLPQLLDGSHFTTVGISHLTTSRRHLAKPVLRAEETADGFLLDGLSPWVTGAAHADAVVIGATLDSGPQIGRQILALLPTDLPGVVGAAAVGAGRAVGQLHRSARMQSRGAAARISSGRPGGKCHAGQNRGEHRRAEHVGPGDRTRRGGDRFSRRASQSRGQSCSPRWPKACIKNRSNSKPVCCDWRAAKRFARANRCEREAIAWRCGRRKRHWSRRKERATSSAIRPAAGAARRCFSWSGVARNRSPRRISANWRDWKALGTDHTNPKR